MPSKHFDQLLSEDKITVKQGLEGLVSFLPKMEGEQLEEACYAVTNLFHVDPIDHPEMIPVLEQAENLLAEQGDRIVSTLLKTLTDSDLKAHFHIASVMGKIGREAIKDLADALGATEDIYVKTFILYALGKIKSQEVTEVLPLMFEALDDAEQELRDTAARAMGKVCEHASPEGVTSETKRAMFEKLMERTSDATPGVRSKAIRSLGKMAKHGFLLEEHSERLDQILKGVLGETGNNWDSAFIVRSEAKKALKNL